MSIRTIVTTLGMMASLAVGAPALAQSGAIAPTEIQTDERAPAGPETLVLQERRGQRPPPLGAEMFSASTASTATSGRAAIDPNHILRPGDQVQVTLWGLVNENQSLTVDPQGNVVVPGVGPVALAGVPASRAPAVIEAASRRVYSSGVQIYATATSAAPTQVLVTGPVLRPGAYEGASDDALIIFLQRAGGIDPERGSYRRVRIVRDGVTVATADLYDFLQSGLTPRISFRSGDAVVVEAQGATVAVSGDVRSAYSFELVGATGQGSEIMTYARPRPGATHVAITGVRNGAPFSTYLTLADFSAFTVADGDRVQFEADARATDLLVRVEGAHDGQSVFSLSRGATVGSVLQQLVIGPDADVEAIHLRRDSVRRVQKALLTESLDRLERTTLLAPTRTASEASARAAQAEFTAQYVARARQVEPLGVLALNGRDPNAVLLETGDVIVIPKRSQVVSIAGEVLAPQSVLATDRGRVSDYIDIAGGFGPRADRRRILVFKQDGQLRAGGYVLPGDRILVLSKPESTLIPLLGDIAVMLLAVARLTD